MGARQPLVGRAVVCLSSVDWDHHWQGNQEIMARLAAAGDQVLYIENTGVRSPRLADLGRLIKRLRRWFKGVNGFNQERPNLLVLSPLLLPFPYARWARPINAWLLARAVLSWQKAVHCDTPVLWSFLPTPLCLDLIDALDPPAVVYYCGDDLQASSPEAGESRTSEAELFRKADLVFVTSRELQRKALRFRQEAHYFPFAVDFETFSACRLQAPDEPADVAAIPHPRCGYLGGVHQYIDLPLLAQAARKNPQASFVLVGPLQTDVSCLRREPNIFLLGGRPHGEVPKYVRSFDVGMIPYRVCRFTESVYPTKLNEYLAMGIPVLSTGLPEVLAYNRDHGGIVSIASSAAEFSQSITALTCASGANHAQARIEAAQANGWGERLEQMAELIRQKVDRSHRAAPTWPEIARRLSGRRRSLALAATAICVFFLALLRLTPLVWWLAGPLIVTAPAVSADAVVVLAGGAGESGVAGQGHEERLAKALELYRGGYAPKLLFCSGYTRAFREIDVMRDIAVAEGVPAEAMILVRQGGSTDTMIGEADSAARRLGWNRLLVVSSPYHMRRALLVWRRINPGIEVIPTPAERSEFYGFRRLPGRPPHLRPPTFEQMSGILREYAAIVYYRIRGRL